MIKNKMFKGIMVLVLAMMLMAGSAYAAVKTPVQDLTNLPTSATAGDTCTVILLGENMTYGSGSFWYPTRLAPPSVAVTYAASVYTYDKLPVTDADNTCRAVYTLGKIYKSVTGVWYPIDVLSPAVITGITPSRGSTLLTADANLLYVNATGLLAGTTGRTFALQVTATRPDGSRFTTGGDDAALKVAATNYNTTSQDNYVLRGMNVGAVTRDGGSLGTLGNFVSSTQKASSPVVNYLNGLEIKVEEDSPNATVPTSIYGLNVIYDIVMASPATSAGIRVVNDSDTALTDPLAAFEVSQTAADRKWQYGIYLDATTVSTADIMMHSGDTLNNAAAGTITASGALASTTTVNVGTNISMAGPIAVYSGTAATRAAVRALVGDAAPQGSMFVGISSVATTKPNCYIKVLNAGNDSDWERIITQASD